MIFFFQAEDGIRELVRSRGLGDVYKRQALQRGENPMAVLMQMAERYGGVIPLSIGNERVVLSLIHI